MPLRDVALTVVVLGLLPVCFVRPWIGVLVWSWLGFMNPHRLTWGFASALPFAQMIAAATLGGLVLSRDWKPLPRVAETYLLLALWGVFLASTLFAVYPEEAWSQFVKVSKILLMTMVTIVLLQDFGRLWMFFWVMGLSIGFYGLKGGVWAVTTGGQNQVLGPAGSFIAGNTEIGLALNMVLPIFLALRRESKQPLVRHFLLAMFGFSIVAILITYSRGALLALAAVLAMLFLKSQAKALALAVVVVAIPVALSSLPDQWFERMETIGTYEEDRSATNRLESWYVAYQIALDRPVLGAGFRPFTVEMYRRYDPEGRARSADAHSIFFQVLAEHGFTGLALYVALIGSSVLSLRRLVRQSRGDPSARWIQTTAEMLQASLVAYVVGGAFLSLSYFDLFLGLVAAIIIMKQLVRERRLATAPAPKSVAVTHYGLARG